MLKTRLSFTVALGSSNNLKVTEKIAPPGRHPIHTFIQDKPLLCGWEFTQAHTFMSVHKPFRMPAEVRSKAP